MSHTHREYLPAAGSDWALPFYDVIVKWLGGEAARKELLDQASLQPGQRILDVGCGTGTMATAVKRANQQVEVIGIDPDPKVLRRARDKAVKAGVSIQLDQGFADQLPYADASFDRVFSSFMFHHLPAEDKNKALHAMRRVLKTGGSLHLVDFEGPEDGQPTFLQRLFHHSDRLKDNSEHRVLELMREAGFANPSKLSRRKMPMGWIGYFRAQV
jgi:ubiquinone/menaquinone biosynthesis C-methylase UbiE